MSETATPETALDEALKAHQLSYGDEPIDGTVVTWYLILDDPLAIVRLSATYYRSEGPNGVWRVLRRFWWPTGSDGPGSEDRCWMVGWDSLKKAYRSKVGHQTFESAQEALLNVLRFEWEEHQDALTQSLRCLSRVESWREDESTEDRKESKS